MSEEYVDIMTITSVVVFFSLNSNLSGKIFFNLHYLRFLYLYFIYIVRMLTKTSPTFIIKMTITR